MDIPQKTPSIRPASIPGIPRRSHDLLFLRRARPRPHGKGILENPQQLEVLAGDHLAVADEGVIENAQTGAGGVSLNPLAALTTFGSITFRSSGPQMILLEKISPHCPSVNMLGCVSHF
jgi:hypothetical protein